MCIFHVLNDSAVSWRIFFEDLNLITQFHIVCVQFINFWIFLSLIDELCEDLDVLDGLKQLQLSSHFHFTI
jgi:hypothetical protein